MSAPGSSSLYRLEDIRHRYGARTVLALPALTIAEGETLGIVGPSGAGKTTLLRLLQFLERPTHGRISFRGHEVGAPAPLDAMRRITTVFQRPLMLDRSVRDNIGFGQRLRGRRADALVDDLLERVSLTPLARSAARTLSGGEMQRVALARAMATQPDVLLLDEPAANLDPANVALVEGLIRAEQARGTTLVLVTHNTHEARRLADRTLLLIDGQPVEVAATEVFFTAPADPRTRAFLGGELVY